MKPNFLLLAVILLIAGSLYGCASPDVPEGKLNVVATTSILADVVRQVGGEHVSVTTLVPLGADVHDFQPRPRDIALLVGADLIFEVGLNLEKFLNSMIENAGGSAPSVNVSEGVQVKNFAIDDQLAKVDEHSNGDPHVWMDPGNVIIWVRNIQNALSNSDPARSEVYKRNGEAYIQKLSGLDSWIAAQVAAIPADQRRIVTDHMQFGYFAEKYGFEVVGAIIPSYNSAAQPSAQELAALENAIREHHVKAILVGNTINPELANQVVQDTGILLVPVYTGSLSESDGPAGNYIDYMRYNVTAILEALRR